MTPEPFPTHPNSTARALEKLSLGNLEIDTHTEPALIDEVLEHAMTGTTTRHIATINAQFYVLADQSQPFRDCLASADYRCADGMPIVWACRTFANTRVARITGVDLIGDLCREGASRGMRVFLLGGRPGTAVKTALHLQEQYPGIQIAGVACPDWGFEKDGLTLRKLLDRIAASKPNVLFVALGAPKQEFFIAKYIRPLGIPIAVGIGGSFEILSGEVHRAPEWMRTAGLEWAFRLMQDPGRLWRRYMLGNIEFLWCVLKWRYRMMRAAPPQPAICGKDKAIPSVKDRLRHSMSGTLASNSMWILSGQALSLVAQAIYFFAMARLLGTYQYGLFVGVSATINLVGHYSSFGSGLLFLRYVSPDHSRFPEYWGNILLSTFTLGTVFVSLFAGVSSWYLHSTLLRMVIMLSIIDCICGQLSIAMVQVFQAFEKMRYTAILNLLTTGVRMLTAVMMLITLHHADASRWVACLLAISAASTLAGIVMVTLHFGLPRFRPRLWLERAREGFAFAVYGSAVSIYNDFDKAMLAHLGMNAANGIYTMAYRAIDIGAMPIRSIHDAALPRFFRDGATFEGLHATERFARRLLRRTSPMGVAATVALFVAAPLIPRLAGPGFASSVTALRWLCPLPFIRAFQLSAADALAGAGKQGLRVVAHILAACLNIVLNLFLIPRYSWVGAAWASLATDAPLGVALWCLVIAINHRRASTERRTNFYAHPLPPMGR